MSKKIKEIRVEIEYFDKCKEIFTYKTIKGVQDRIRTEFENSLVWHIAIRPTYE